MREAIILEMIKDKHYTRDDIALQYAECIRKQVDMDATNINKAIIRRWSKSGLEHIKNLAWKIAEGKE